MNWACLWPFLKFILISLDSEQIFTELNRMENLFRFQRMESPCIMSVQYTRGCSVHRGIHWVHRRPIEYTGWISWVHRQVFSTLGIPWVHWGISWVKLGDIMSTLGVFSTLGDTMSTLWDTMMSVGGYLEYNGGCSLHRGFHQIQLFSQWHSRTFIMISPGVLMISLQGTEHSHCTHDIPRCTEHPPVYCNPRCTAQTFAVWGSAEVFKWVHCWFHGSSFIGSSIVFLALRLAKIESSQKLNRMCFSYMDDIIIPFNPNLYGGGRGKFAPRQFFATAQKRLALDCWNFVTFIVSLLHIIWYTFWSPGT